MKKQFKETLHLITTFIFDVDGVLTNGNVILFPNGELIRQMSVRDGFAIKVATEAGYKVAIISGGTNEDVRNRLKLLGVNDIYLKVQDKVEKFYEYCDAYQLKPEEILYMGDDIPDIGVMKLVGAATAPQDADVEVLKISDYISQKSGGSGCVRDVIEQVMRVQGKWKIDNVSPKFG